MKFIIRSPLIILFLILVSPVTADEYRGVVSKVVDGDTIDVKVDNKIIKRVRLRYIDAPEKNQSFGKEATSFLKKELLGKTVIVNTEYKGRYKRDIGDVFVYDENIAIYINAKLIKSGNAWVYKTYRKNTYLMNLENHARSNIIGLWKSSNPMKPWVFRQKNRE
tara:strand:+ start:2075 stop:2566 length:492 start_codon:yes stop_codon:yes gene_type:complete